MYYFFGSIASFTVPLITGVLSTTSMRAAMTGDLVVGLIGSALMLVVLISERGVTMAELEQLRNQINQVDERLVALFKAKV